MDERRKSEFKWLVPSRPIPGRFRCMYERIVFQWSDLAFPHPWSVRAIKEDPAAVMALGSRNYQLCVDGI